MALGDPPVFSYKIGVDLLVVADDLVDGGDGFPLFGGNLFDSSAFHQLADYATNPTVALFILLAFGLLSFLALDVGIGPSVDVGLLFGCGGR